MVQEYVMRYVKPFYKYDEWLADLAPSRFLLYHYRKLRMDWDMYASAL